MFESFKEIKEQVQISEKTKKMDIEKALPYAFRDSEKIYNRTAEILYRFHNEKVNAIFLTWSSASLYGFMLKESWKKVFPGEDVPKFYFINVKPLKRLDIAVINDKEQQNELIEKQDNEIDRIGPTIDQILTDNKNAKIAVFDEAYDGTGQDITFKFGKSVNLAKKLIEQELRKRKIKNYKERVIIDGLGVDQRSHPYFLFKPIDEVSINNARRSFRSEDAPIIMGKEAIDAFKEIGKEIGERMLKEKSDIK